MEKHLIKKYIMFISSLIIGLITLLITLEALEHYDYTLVTFADSVTWDDNQRITSDVRGRPEIAIFTRSENTYVSTEWKKGTLATVYTCGENYFFIKNLLRINGRFLWDSDSKDRKSYAVIDENLSTMLFAGKECIGEKITLGGAEYSVVGVCGAEDGILTSVDKYAVYLPMDAYSVKNTQSGCLLRAADDIALTFALQTDIKIAGGIRSVQNLKILARMVSIPARLALLIICLMTFVCTVKITIKYTSYRIAEAREELKNLYFQQYLKKHSLFIGMHLAAIIVLFVIFILWFLAVSFTVIIDSELIPRSLIDILGWINNIKAYSQKYNSAHNIPFSPSYQISIYGWVAAISSVVCIWAAGKTLQNIKLWIIEILKKKWTLKVER